MSYRSNLEKEKKELRNKMCFKKCTNPKCNSLGENPVLHYKVRGELFECQICFEIGKDEKWVKKKLEQIVIFAEKQE